LLLELLERGLVGDRFARLKTMNVDVHKPREASGSLIDSSIPGWFYKRLVQNAPA
jgi:hypothetical protein